MTSGKGITDTGDGQPDRAPATYTFPSGTASEAIALTFTDHAGARPTAALTVTVNKPPAAAAAPPLTPGPEPEPPSGSGGAPVTTAGATITIHKTVVVTGRSPRCIPVAVETDRPRAFTATLETVKRKRELASGALRLESAGRGVIHVTLPKKVKPGTYVIVVRVMTLMGKHVGKAVSRRFTLR